MIKVSQNRKIAIASIAIFAVSFAVMMLFLGTGAGGLQTDVLKVNGGDHGEVEAEYAQGVSFVTDSEAKVVYAEESFCNSIGAPCSALIGKSIFDYVHRDDVSELIGKYTRIIQDEEGFSSAGPFRIGNKKYEKLVLLDAEPIIESGRVHEINFVVKDLSDKIDEIEEDDASWTKNLYPKIRDMKDEDGRLMVDKITFKVEEK